MSGQPLTGPDWLITWLTEADEARRNGRAEAITPEGAPVSDGSGITDPIGRKALNDELRKLGETPKGARNDQLNRSAYKLGQLVGGGHLNAQEAWQGLSAKGREIGLGASEVYKTLRSGFYGGQQHPRTLEPRGNGNVQVNEMSLEEIRVLGGAFNDSDPEQWAGG